MFNWRNEVYGNDPDDPIAIEKFISWYVTHREQIQTWEKAVLPACEGKRVLDVGAVCHNKYSVNDHAWKHRKIKNVASYILAVDILKEMIDWINKEGDWNFVYADATSSIELGDKFDVVVMGDLIEHVDNIKGLLEFGKRHLNTGGCLYITTPNPCFIELLNREIYESVPIANMEHTCWITPTNMNELCYRVGLSYERTFEIVPNNLGGEGWIKRNLPHAFKVQSYIYVLKKVFEEGSEK